MPSINDTPPARVQADLASLGNALDSTLPPKVEDQNLLIATWNIKRFGGARARRVSGVSACGEAAAFRRWSGFTQSRFVETG